MRAVTIVACPDVVLALPSMNHRRFWPASWMGLALDELGTLHLLSGQKGSGLLGEITGELRQWPIHDVKVAIKSNRGWWRVVEISDDTETYIVLAPFVLPSQRAAMRSIADSSGA